MDVKKECHGELTLSLFPDPDGEYTYVIPSGSHELIEDFMSLDGVESFSYCRDTCKPNGISDEESTRREAICERLFVSSVPSKDAFTYHLVGANQVSCLRLTEAELNDYLTSRWENYFHHHLMNELINQNLRCIKAENPEYGPISVYDLATSFAKINLIQKPRRLWNYRRYMQMFQELLKNWLSLWFDI